MARGIHGTVSVIRAAKHSLLTANVSTSIQGHLVLKRTSV